jgi:hypothetical protein
MRAFIAIVALLVAAQAQAGIYSDDMARCLVKSTSPEDKTALVRWVFAIASLHPGVADVAAMSAKMREQTDRTVAALFERLVTEDCRTESQDAMRYEGPDAFEQSFQVLGEVAMTELMAHQAVGAGFQAFTQYIDESKFEALRP